MSITRIDSFKNTPLGVLLPCLLFPNFEPKINELMKTIKPLVTLITATFILNACEKNDVEPKENVLYETDFRKNDGSWWTGTLEDGQANYQNGQYVIEGSSLNKGESMRPVTLSRVFSGSTSNTAIETSVKIEYTTSPDYGVGGVIWNYTSTGTDYSYYALLISHGGHWSIAGYDSASDKWTYTTDWEISSVIRKNDFNTVRIVREKGKIICYINDTRMINLTADDSIVLDRVGLYSISHSKLTARHFKAYELP